MSNLPDTFPSPRRIPPRLRISTDVPLLTKHSSNPSSSSSSPTNQNTTSEDTPSTGSPQCSFHVLCMHDFESSDPVHLAFHKDEVLTIIKQEHSGWWAAMRSGGDRIGWIPSSFVLPLRRSKILGFPDEKIASYGDFNDPPLSALHDPWVPVSEDYRALLSFQLVTPTDLVLYKSFFNDRAWSHDYETFFSLSNDEQSSDMRDTCVPPKPGRSPPHRTRRPQFPQSPLLTESATQLTKFAGLPLFDSPLYRRPRPCEIDGQGSFLYLTTPIGSDEIAPQVISSLDPKDWLVAFGSVAKDAACSDGAVLGQSESLRLPASVRLARPDHHVSDIKLLDLAIWGPDNLAEQLCLLMHTLCATIHQHDCLDWMARRRDTEMTGLRQFFDVHDHIASWVQDSVLTRDNMTQQTKALDFWVSVAEKCQSLRNFDSLCAIILALSGPSLSSLGSAWAQCTQRQTFAKLCETLDVSNQFRRLLYIMDAARGPSVPFVYKYLDDIEKLQVGRSDDPFRPSGHGADESALAVARKTQLPAISNMLRHQSLPYDF